MGVKGFFLCIPFLLALFIGASSWLMHSPEPFSETSKKETLMETAQFIANHPKVFTQKSAQLKEPSPTPESPRDLASLDGTKNSEALTPPSSGAEPTPMDFVLQLQDISRADHEIKKQFIRETLQSLHPEQRKKFSGPLRTEFMASQDDQENQNPDYTSFILQNLLDIDGLSPDMREFLNQRGIPVVDPEPPAQDTHSPTQN